jgi:hypothetical protein
MPLITVSRFFSSCTCADDIVRGRPERPADCGCSSIGGLFHRFSSASNTSIGLNSVALARYP